MRSYSGFVYVVDEAERARRLEEHLSVEDSFSDAWSASDWGLRQLDVILLSLDGLTVSYVALVRRGIRVATDKVRVMFSNIVRLDAPIALSELQTIGPRNQAGQAIRSTTGHGIRLAPKYWTSIVEHLTSRQSTATAERVHALLRLVDLDPHLFARPGFDIVAEERDAVNLALRIAGLDHNAILAWTPRRDNRPAPFLEGLSSVDVREDALIVHDQHVFGDWELIRRAQVGSVSFRNSGGRHLTIVNANRTTIEETLGVDLIYYFEEFGSYLLVQYKRMVAQGTDVSYRPTDKTYHAELERMRRFRDDHPDDTKSSELASYRLHADGFYFKLCPIHLIDPTSAEMIKGMYFPLDLWEFIATSDLSKGPKGGRVIGYNTVKRYLSNTLFIQLAEAGWIGTRSLRSGGVSQVIQAALQGKRSVILAHAAEGR